MGKRQLHTPGEISKEEFNQIIYSFLDGEASEDEVAYLETKCNSCEQTAALYKSECQFYNMIKTNLIRSHAPHELADVIRECIKGQAVVQ